MNKRFILLLLITFIIGSCAPASLPSSLTAAATLIITYPATMTVTLDVPTQISPATNFSITQIRTPSDTDGREVLTAFWSQDGSIVYYALADEIPDALSWFELKVSKGQITQDRELSLSPKLTYTPSLPISGVYLEYQGLVSPRGRYHFQITQAENDSLYLLDKIEQSKVKLLETPDMNFRGAYWMPDENSVVFGIGPEYGTFFYLYNILELNLLSLEEMVGYADPNISEWALSADGNHIAILDGNQSLKLLSLDGSFSTTIPGYVNNVRWSGDSQRVYYYSGFQLYDPTSIGYFDMVTKTSTNVMPLSELEIYGVHGFFDVSPDGGQLIFWQAGNIWLLSFH